MALSNIDETHRKYLDGLKKKLEKVGDILESKDNSEVTSGAGVSNTLQQQGNEWNKEINRSLKQEMALKTPTPVWSGFLKCLTRTGVTTVEATLSCGAAYKNMYNYSLLPQEMQLSFLSLEEVKFVTKIILDYPCKMMVEIKSQENLKEGATGAIHSHYSEEDAGNSEKIMICYCCKPKTILCMFLDAFQARISLLKKWKNCPDYGKENQAHDVLNLKSKRA